jgi:uncharacterized protein YjbI with pentapeptide repeats
MSKSITTMSLYGDIFYKNNNNNHKAYVYLQLKKRCLIQEGGVISSISSNPKNIVTAMARFFDTASNKGLLATAASSHGFNVFKIQNANIVKKNSIRMLKLTTSNKELHSKDKYAKNVTQIIDDNIFKSASVIIYSLSLVNNTPLCAPNCQGANLIRRNLTGANLRGANLEGADLRGANLSRANLTDARLMNAELRFARFDFANLTGASLACANVSGANFADIRTPGSQANLTDTNFRGARGCSQAFGLPPSRCNN